MNTLHFSGCVAFFPGYSEEPGRRLHCRPMPQFMTMPAQKLTDNTKQNKHTNKSVRQGPMVRGDDDVDDHDVDDDERHMTRATE